jgi:signal transduction histidine kinase
MRKGRQVARRDSRSPRDERQAGGRWRLRNWRLRTKLLAVLLIPAIAIVALVGLRIKADLDGAEHFERTAARARVDDRVTEVVHQLQRERDLTVRYVAADRQADLGELRTQRQRVDAALGEFDREFAAERDRLAPEADDVFRQVQDRLATLTGLRYAGEQTALPASEVLRSYSGLISGLIGLTEQAVSAISDPQLARLRLATGALARIKDQKSIQRAVLGAALVEGELSRERLRALLAAQAELRAARADFGKFASAEQRRMYDDTVIGLVVDIGNDMVASAVTRGADEQPLTGLDAQRWDTAATYTVNLVKRVEDALQVQAEQRTTALAEEARRSAYVDAAVVLGVLVVAAALALIIARSLLRPLRVLRGSALDVAEHRLPAAVEEILTDPRPQPEGAQRRHGIAPVPVFSREELGQVARAFDAVHGQAVRLAGEQAMLRENVNSMFANLSQRSQDLVERQLGVLDRMEADEQDPDTLGGLFELDHLATRMRRNSENLLVLSGQDLDRVYGGPATADDVIGAALSEVEHYQRVVVERTPAVSVHGEVVSDLVHLVAELLENATDYSGADTTVTVTSSMTAAGEWRIDITDAGAGMAAPEIRRANARLAEPPEVDVEVSRRMGLYVVGRLAQLHGIGVRLSPARTGGLTATVLVPAGVVTHRAPPRPVSSARSAVPAAPPVPTFPPGPHPAEDAAWPTAEDAAQLSPVPVRPPAGTGTPRRAPVESWEYPVSWPAQDDDLLEMDAPTERMPAYRDLLAQWFDSAVEQARAAEEAWPAAELPKRVPRSALVPSPADTPAMDESPVVSRDPEAIRGRMSSLQNGVQRGRDARGEREREDA